MTSAPFPRRGIVAVLAAFAVAIPATWLVATRFAQPRYLHVEKGDCIVISGVFGANGPDMHLRVDAANSPKMVYLRLDTRCAPI